MKSKRRHQLETNELADLMGDRLESIKAYIPWILVGVVAIPAAVWGISWLRSQSARTANTAWTEYYDRLSATDLESRADGLEQLANNHGDAPAAVWALQSAADSKLREGLDEVLKDHDKAKSKLDKARQLFQEVADKSSEPFFRHRALFGMAQAYEGMSEPAKAKDQYVTIYQEAPDSAIGKAARRRLIQLVDPGTGKRDENGEVDLATCELRSSIKELYAQLATYEPPPVTTSTTGPDGSTYDLSQLPSTPDLSFPGMEDFEEAAPPSGGSFDPGTSPPPPTPEPGSSSDPAPEPPKPETPETSDPPAEPAKPDAPASDEPDAPKPEEPKLNPPEDPTKPAEPADPDPKDSE